MGKVYMINRNFSPENKKKLDIISEKFDEITPYEKSEKPSQPGN
jgi:hypothetical protein